MHVCSNQLQTYNTLKKTKKELNSVQIMYKKITYNYVMILKLIGVEKNSSYSS